MMVVPVKKHTVKESVEPEVRQHPLLPVIQSCGKKHKEKFPSERLQAEDPP